MAAPRQLTRLSCRALNHSTLATRTFSTSPRILESSSTPQQTHSKTTYPFYPSVTALLHAHKISPETAAKIPASGPKGRLLKGDVLSYLGAINRSYSSAQSARITKLEHLDLSNITVATPPKAAPPPVKEEVKLEEVEPDTEVAVSVRLEKVLDVQTRIQDTLGVLLPLSTFLARATELANDDLPKATGTTPTADELFNEVLGLNNVPSKTSRGSYTPQITALPTPGFGAKALMKKNADIIDLLSGTSKSTAGLRGMAAPPESVMVGKLEGVSTNVFSISVKKGEEKRARVFLERVKTILQVEPGKLLL